MIHFRMTAEKARVLFNVKDGELYWAENEAVFESVRGKLAGWSGKGGNKVVTAMTCCYATSDLVCLIESGEWPCYEDMITCAAAIKARYKETKKKQLTEDYIENIQSRIELVDRMVEERSA